MFIELRDRRVVSQMSSIFCRRFVRINRMVPSRRARSRVRLALLRESHAQSVLATLQLQLLQALLLDDHVPALIQADAPTRHIILQRSIAATSKASRTYVGARERRRILLAELLDDGVVAELLGTNAASEW